MSGTGSGWGDGTKELAEAAKALRNGFKLGNHVALWMRARAARKQLEAEFGREVADAVVAAIRAGKNYEVILERARQSKRDREERDNLLKSPPPLHGSARWATTADLGSLLQGREAFAANPSSILLGAHQDPETGHVGFLHWDDVGHLLTVAPTRAGKSVTTIVPNLLRYKGSMVVIDPKSELYAQTSAWRAREVGPVYRIAPFDQPDDPATRGFPRHRFNPMMQVTSDADARGLAGDLYAPDPRTSDFFRNDFMAMMTAAIRMTQERAPPDQRNLAALFGAINSGPDMLMRVFDAMEASDNPEIRSAGQSLKGKSKATGLPTLGDSIRAALGNFRDAAVCATLSGSDFTFEALKDRPATVYIDVPLHLIPTNVGFLRLILKNALNAMIRNRREPEIPVVFILDEFLQLGSFDDFRTAIRTHAGSGVRLWFFVQDVAGLEENYGPSWRTFFNCAVKQFFGVNDQATADMISRSLGSQTVAYRSTNAGGNVSASAGGIMGDGASSNVSFSTGESVQFIGRPLMTPEEVNRFLSGWNDNQRREWRHGIVVANGVPPVQVRLFNGHLSDNCRSRMGTQSSPPPP